MAIPNTDPIPTPPADKVVEAIIIKFAGYIWDADAGLLVPQRGPTHVELVVAGGDPVMNGGTQRVDEYGRPAFTFKPGYIGGKTWDDHAAVNLVLTNCTWLISQGDSLAGSVRVNPQ